ncbi:D-alanyl-D-alanine carboxypeptidase [Aureimonas leprariae]|uniref:D-alanyl-D-alanine carboxypeptidase n=1 Tax=Plantimonas leprariae TaxID=2615207 RepID=UPI001FEABEEB|nr:D-alanyl-D-alanine carboxypeptidase [Aureimonas leprariae]
MGITPSNRRRLVGTFMQSVGMAGVAVALLAQGAEAADRHSAFVIDANNGKVLYSDDADDLRYPASLTKMMTLYMLFEAMEQGRMSLSTPMNVSAYASARPPTKLRLKPGSTLTAQEAILGLVTLSANDAAVVIAEHLGGSEARFAQMMTAKARQLGMSRTTFRNANGLPNEGQHSTARDMATLGMALREHFPKQYRYFATKSFDFRGRTINSHNRLVGRVKGVDGIKTGYINASGFNLVTSLYDGDRKLVGVVFGGNTAAARDNEMAKLLAKYLPQASTRSTGPLVAERERGSRVLPDPQTASYVPPKEVPAPRFSNRAINARIAAAYDTSAGDAVARVAKPQGRQVVGRDAIREALASAPRQDLLRPASAPAPSAAAYGESRPVPPAEVPGGADFDPQTTGAVAAAATAQQTSPWVVQIAATPDRDQALQMLAEAKAKGGSVLSSATGFTQSVGGKGGTMYRARFAGFATKDAAAGACDVLKKRSYKCFAIAN